MSGFEVVGVILAAAPLIISALEGYQKLGKKRDAFRKKSLHLDRMIKALKWQQTLIQSDVKIVLRNVGFEQEQDHTGANNFGFGQYQDWLQRSEVQDSVEAFLGDNCSSYIEVIKQCENSFVEIAKAVKGFEQGSWVASGSLAGMLRVNKQIESPGNDFWKRVRFSMRKEDLEHRIKEIDDLSRILERLREKSQREAQIVMQSNSTNTKAVVKMLQKVQGRASRLYHALARSWAPTCQHAHSARLYLDDRINSFEANKRSWGTMRSESLQFGITLEACMPAVYHTCIVELTNSESAGQGDKDRNPVITFTTSTSNASNPRRPRISDMCQVMNNCASIGKNLKLYLSDDEKLSYDHFKSDGSDYRFEHAHKESMVSLQSLLEDPTLKKRLQLKQRVRLAVIVASSVLQLHTTPWCETLRHDSFLFVQDSSGQIDMTHPLVICRFNAIHSKGSVTSLQAESELLDLGILILELWHSETIDSFAKQASLSLGDSYDSRQSVARRWIADTKDELLTSIYDAAVRCVNCRFDLLEIDFADPKLNTGIFEGVIKPLWEDCKR